jgi:hypothetical protein
MSSAPRVVLLRYQEADIAEAVVFLVTETRIGEEGLGKDVVTVLAIGRNGKNASRYWCAIAQVAGPLSCQEAEKCVSKA